MKGSFSESKVTQQQDLYFSPLLKDYWVLKFWFQGNADGLTRKKTFTDYFQELMNPKNFPKSMRVFLVSDIDNEILFDQFCRIQT